MTTIIRSEPLMRAQVESRLVRLSAGFYELDGIYVVERAKGAWRWRKIFTDIGGEWRLTKREAVLDLTHYLNSECVSLGKRGAR